MRRDAIGLLLIVAAVPGSGAELVIRDLDARFEILPTAFTYTVDNASFSRNGPDSFRSSFGMALGGRYSLAGPGRSWGPVVGADLAVADGRNDGVQFQASEVRGVAGLAWQASSELTCLAQLTAGLGYGRMSLDTSGGRSSGPTGSLMPGVGLWWRTGERTRLTADLGWRQFAAQMHHGDTAIDLRQSGACIAIGISWGISRAPWSLE